MEKTKVAFEVRLPSENLWFVRLRLQSEMGRQRLHPLCVLEKTQTRECAASFLVWGVFVCKKHTKDKIVPLSQLLQVFVGLFKSSIGTNHV